MSNNSTLGPRELYSPNSPFLLSRSEWLSVQCYVTAALHLPTTLDKLFHDLPADPSSGADKFPDLLEAYTSIQTHCDDWNKNTLPKSVNLAGDVVEYSRMAPIYYGALNKFLDKMQNGDAKAREEFCETLGALSNKAKSFKTNAETVFAAMKKFSDQTGQDQLNIKPIQSKYLTRYGDQSPILKDLHNKLVNAKGKLHHYKEKYEQDVIVAATSATYAWVVPAGTVAAAVTAGVYGHRATEDLLEIKKWNAKVSLLEDDIKAAALLNAELLQIKDQLGDIIPKLDTALPILQKISGVWGAISDDLDRLSTNALTEIADYGDFIKDLAIEEAIKDWTDVGKEADQYRVNAYIQIVTEEEAQKADSKVPVSN